MLCLSGSTVSTGMIDTTKDTIDAAKEAKEIAEFVYDLLSLKVWDGDWKVADDEGEPVKHWTKNNRIRAWINITGFRNESVINGTRYVNGSAKDHAIIKRYAKYSMGKGEKKTSFTSTLTVTDSVGINGTKTTAVQKSVLNYKKRVCSFGICRWVAKTTSLTADVTVNAPENLTTRIPNVTVNILVYNRSVAPVTYIYVPIEHCPSMKDVMIVNYTYNGSTVHRYDQVGEVRKNSLGAEYVQFIDGGWYPLWIKDTNQTKIDHCGRLVTVFDPNFNISLLNISLHTPYETKYIENVTMKVISGNVRIPISFIKIVLLLIGSSVGLIIIWRVAKRALF